MVASRHILPPKRFWLDWEVEFLQRNYADALNVDLAQVLDMEPKRILAKANALGLHKSRAVVAEMQRQKMLDPNHGGRKAQFGPGHPPANKGLRRPGWAPGDMAKTQFKPGARPHTWVPVGSYRICEGQLQLKVNDLPGPNTVRRHPVSRIVWERANGPVPAGHKVVFKPGRATTDPTLITLDAVECITDAELMRRNSIHRLHPQFAELARLKGQLHRAINTRLKKESHEQDH